MNGGRHSRKYGLWSLDYGPVSPLPPPQMGGLEILANDNECSGMRRTCPGSSSGRFMSWSGCRARLGMGVRLPLAVDIGGTGRCEGAEGAAGQVRIRRRALCYDTLERRCSDGLRL